MSNHALQVPASRSIRRTARFAGLPALALAGFVSHGSLPLVPTTLHGTARTPVPGNPVLLGLRVDGQYAVFDANGASFGGFALSDGIEFRVRS